MFPSRTDSRAANSSPNKAELITTISPLFKGNLAGASASAGGRVGGSRKRDPPLYPRIIGTMTSSIKQSRTASNSCNSPFV